MFKKLAKEVTLILGFVAMMALVFGVLPEPSRAANDNCSSTGTANWLVTSTWTSCNSSFPGDDSGDSATIVTAHTVTMNGALTNTLSSLTVNGTLVDGVATTLDVDGNVAINSGGTVNFSTNNSNLSVAGNFSNAGTFTKGTGTVTFDGTGNQSVTAGGGDLGAVIVSNTGGTITLQDNVTADNFTLNSGTILDLNGNTLTVNGTFTNNGATINANGGSIDANGGFTLINNLMINGNFNIPSNSTYNLGNFTLTVNGSLGISGTLNVNSGTLSVTGDVTNDGTFQGNTGTFLISGGFTNNNGASANAGTGSHTIASNFTNASGGTFSVDSSTLDIDGNFSNSGTFNGSTGTVNLAGDFTSGGMFNAGTGTFVFDGTGTQSINSAVAFYNLTNKNSNNNSLTVNAGITVGNNLYLTNGGTYKAFSNHTVNNVTIDPNTTLDLNDHTLTVNGSITNNGTTSIGSGTVIFSSNASHTISGETEFDNLTFQPISPNLALTFPSVTTVNGDLNIQGSSANRATLTGSSSGWQLNVTQPITIGYVAVQNTPINNGSGTILALNSTGSAGTGWVIISGTTAEPTTVGFKEATSIQLGNDSAVSTILISNTLGIEGTAGPNDVTELRIEVSYPEDIVKATSVSPVRSGDEVTITTSDIEAGKVEFLIKFNPAIETQDAVEIVTIQWETLELGSGDLIFNSAIGTDQVRASATGQVETNNSTIDVINPDVKLFIDEESSSDVPDYTIFVGETLTTEVRVESIVDATQFAFTGTFETDFLEIQEIIPGPLFGDNYERNLNEVDEDDKQFRFDYEMTNSQVISTGVDNEGVIAYIVWKGIAVGTSDQDLTAGSYNDGSAVATIQDGGDIKVVAQTINIKFEESEIELADGATTTQKVVLEDVYDLEVVEFSFTYDASIVEIESFQFLSPFDDNSTTLDDGTSGAVNVRVNLDTAITSDAEMLEITWKGVAEGTSNLTFTNVDFEDDAGNQVARTSENGKVTVGEGSGDDNNTGDDISGTVRLEGATDHTEFTVHADDVACTSFTPSDSNEVSANITANGTNNATFTVTGGDYQCLMIVSEGYLTVQQANPSGDLGDTELPGGDANNDGSVTIVDLSIIAAEYGETSFEEEADINNDGEVSIIDLSVAAGSYGRQGPVNY